MSKKRDAEKKAAPCGHCKGTGRVIYGPRLQCGTGKIDPEHEGDCVDCLGTGRALSKEEWFRRFPQPAPQSVW